MAIDTPAKIAILGAGPIGLEAALYARFLGYDVALYERGDVAENVLQWGHVRMFSTFGMNRSPLGLAALAAQDADYRPPGDDAVLTGRQWVEQYLAPLSQTDLVADHLRLRTTVAQVGREKWLKHEAPAAAERGESPFLILLRNEQGVESMETADVVIDTTGVFANPNWLGRGGIAAIGETVLRERIEYGLPDAAGRQRADYAGKHTLLIGSGYSAATTATALAELAGDVPNTKSTWITRRPLAAGQGPIQRIEGDALRERDELARCANECAAQVGGAVEHWPETEVVSVAAAGEQFEVELAGLHGGCYRFDRIVANVGYRPDNEIYRELQVHECYATGGPMKLAASLMGATSGDCLQQPALDAATLINPEPNFYILGAKSYGRNSQFLVSAGLDQIRQVFSIIGGRSDLDLYAGAASLPT